MAARPPDPDGERLAPTPLEIACGMMLGADPGAPPFPEGDPALTPRVVLEQALLPALVRAPCFVTLSGGRDSSAVLAVAVHVARREGLPLPIPITVRFKHAPGTGEREWQELAIRHLGLERWEVLEVDDELDLVGPLATRLLLRHGVRHPAHACLFALLLERAHGGSLLTGVAGDTMFGSWRYSHVLDALALRRRPTRTDLLVAGYGLSPAPIRRFAARMRTPNRPWLTPKARGLFLERVAGEVPRSFNAHLAARLRARSLRSAVATMDLLGQAEDALALDPLCEAPFVAALARAGGKTGLGSRTAIMRSLFGDLLPEALVARADKARFPFAYFRTMTREFARSWSGHGLDSELIDAELLRQAWLELLPNGYGAMALQQAWLASQPGRAGHEPDALAEEVEAPRPA